MITYPNLYHLKYYIDAVEAGSITAAARMNLVTHPAVSRAIAALELHLGIQLLEHRKKSFKLTAAGQKVAEQAKRLLGAANEFGSLKLAKDQHAPVELSIGVSRTLAAHYLMPLLTQLKTNFPQASAKVRFGTTNEIIEAVASKTMDLGFTVGTIPLTTLRQTTIANGHFVLVEAGNKTQWSKDFASKGFIITEARPETEKLKTMYARKFGRPLPILYQISSWDMIARFTQDGFGVGLLPEIAIRDWKKGSYRILKTFGAGHPYAVCAHTLKSANNNLVLNSLIENLR